VETSDEKVDRRKQRTRQALRDALMELMMEKNYTDITLEDITQRANVARPTFYLHFKDKDELLFTNLRDIYENLFHEHLSMITEKPVTEVDARDFEHVRDQADFYRMMLSNKGSLVFFLSVMRYLGAAMCDHMLKPVDNSQQSDPRVPLKFLGRYLAGAQVAVTDGWVQDDFDYTPQQMAEMMHFTSIATCIWALRLNVEPPDVTLP
jgi:AcrR family transcriptional regulator